MRNSIRMHSSKSSVFPIRICASASLRLVGDFVRIVAALLRAKSASAPPDAASRSRSARISSTLSATNSRSIAARCETIGVSPGLSENAPSKASTGTVPVNPSSRSAKRFEGTRCVAIPAATPSPTRKRSPVSAQ
jgi:hypothetical protein